MPKRLKAAMKKVSQSLLILITVLAPGALGQSHGYKYEQTSINAKGQPLVGATITVCASPATGAPCTPLVNIFADEGLTTPLPNPTHSDSLGNWFFYIAPGVYTYTVSGNGIHAQGPIQITVPCVINGTNCGGGGTSNGVDINVIAKGTGPTNPLVDSSGFDDAVNSTQWPLGLNVISQGLLYQWANETTTGTTQYKTVIHAATYPQVVIAPTSATSGILGIAKENAGTTGSVQVVFAGRAQVIFDNTSVPGDWAIPSTTTSGELHDTASTTETPGVQNFLVVGANSGAHTSGLIVLLSPDSIGNSVTGCGSVMNTLGDSLYGGVGGICTRLAGSTTPNGVPRVWTSTASGGVATAPTLNLFGLGYRDVTTTPDPFVATDRANGVHYSRTTAIAATIASAVSFGSNFATYGLNKNIGPVTLTPTTSNINGHSSVIFYYGDFFTLSSNNTDYTARITRAGHTCSIPIGTDNGSVLVDADLGPQGGICEVPPYPAKVIEIDVKADAGTPSVIVRKEHGASNTNLLSGALSTGAAGVIACSNAGGTLSIDGVTTCTNTLQNVDVTPGDWFGLTSGTAGGTAKRMSISIVFGETP